MKKKILVFMCLVLCYISIFAENLHLFKYNNKYGYINDKKEVVIKPQYDFAEKFYNDYAIVGCINEKGQHFYSLINKKNENVDSKLNNTSTFYDLGNGWFYSNFDRFLYNVNTKIMADIGFSKVRGIYYPTEDYYISIDNKFMSLNGEMIHLKNDNYIHTYPMVEGLAFAKDNDWNQVLIDIEGNVVVKDVFDCASEFSEGFMSISTKNDSGYINNKGEYIIHCSFEPNFHEFWPPGINYPFKEGVAVPQVDYKVYKMYDNKGKEIMSETKLNYCSYCNDGLILCQKEENGEFGYLNKKGKQEINFIFDSASDFYNGYAQVVYQGKDAVIDKKGNLYYSEDIINGNKKSSLNVK